jgi:hypothetical protein
MVMAVERLDPATARIYTLRSLGLDPEESGLDSAVAYAALVRRAASFLCPTNPGALVRAVAEVASPLSAVPMEELRRAIEAVLESVIACGDLFELPIEDMGTRRRTTFLGPPAFVGIGDLYLLLGVRGEGAPIVSDQLEELVEYRGHMRLIRTPDPAAREVLTSEGLIELRSEQWLRAPRLSSPHELVSRYGERLDAAGKASSIEGLRILDPSADVRFYRGRWREPQKRDEGRFIARRPQAFGAPLWCWSELAGGELTALIDLPIQSPLARGCDEAWHLQAALDAISEHPQHLRVREAPSTPGAVLLDLFSPLPSWAQRRLEVIATSVARSAGALVTYQLSKDDLEEEANFLKDMMWLVNEEELSSDGAQR